VQTVAVELVGAGDRGLVSRRIPGENGERCRICRRTGLEELRVLVWGEPSQADAL
jgi:hypothetical protein